jgi:hypothetical protein
MLDLAGGVFCRPIFLFCQSSVVIFARLFEGFDFFD